MKRLVISVAVSVFLTIGSAYAQSPLTPPKAGVPGTPKLPPTIKNLVPVTCDKVLSWIEWKFSNPNTRSSFYSTAILVRPRPEIYPSPSVTASASASTGAKIFGGTTTDFWEFPSGRKPAQQSEFGFGVANGILSAYLEWKGTKVRYTSTELTCGSLGDDLSYYVSGRFTDFYGRGIPFFFVYTAEGPLN